MWREKISIVTCPPKSQHCLSCYCDIWEFLPTDIRYLMLRGDMEIWNVDLGL